MLNFVPRHSTDTGLQSDEPEFAKYLDDLTAGIMVCSKEDFSIVYANNKSIEILRSLEHLMPVKADEIIGQCIDIFHKNPSMQREILSDPTNLPHTAVIEYGGESLELTITAFNDSEGNYYGPLLMWDNVTEQIKAKNEVDRLLEIMDTMPVNIMMVDKDNLVINYVNQTSIDTLKELEQWMPVKAAELKGQCIDIFHKNPKMQRDILSDSNNLPHKALIKLGPETLKLNIDAVFDANGDYESAMLIWTSLTDTVDSIDNFESTSGASLSKQKDSSDILKEASKALEDQANLGAERAIGVAAASEQATENVNAVAASAEELSASIEEIARQVTLSTAKSEETTDKVNNTNKRVGELAELARNIGDITKMISDIAGQTNLLALNATIEAARAGDAGKGFAVVASEVKSLAGQTAKATEDITKQITAIQDATETAATAIEEITVSISELNEFSGSVASSVQEQGAATSEISRNVAEAAKGTIEVSRLINEVSSISRETNDKANQVLGAAKDVETTTDDLSQNIDNFLVDVRKLE